ncbi:MAG: substrate-binding domain-containing protein [Neomegalonema sp.]|nr:substrate-binding domain-containing protein [Neomegalonema sp.]
MKKWIARTALLLATLSGPLASARDHVVAQVSKELFGKASLAAEALESMGLTKVKITSAGQLRYQFCKGVGADTPDLVLLSRPLSKKEADACRAKGVQIEAIKLGGAAYGFATASSKSYDLTLAQLWMAISNSRRAPKMWADIDPSLPAERIAIYADGRSGRFGPIVAKAACEAAGGRGCARAALSLRTDAILEVISDEERAAIGVARAPALVFLPVDLLMANTGPGGRLKLVKINGAAPTAENVASGAYPLASQSYIYVKKQHLGVIKGLKDYVDLLKSR